MARLVLWGYYAIAVLLTILSMYAGFLYSQHFIAYQQELSGVSLYIYTDKNFWLLVSFALLKLIALVAIARFYPWWISLIFYIGLAWLVIYLELPDAHVDISDKNTGDGFLASLYLFPLFILSATILNIIYVFLRNMITEKGV